MIEPSPSQAVIRAWTRLLRAQHAVLSAVEADLRAAGFPPLAWYDVLLELSREDGLRPVAIEGRLLLAQYNVSRLVERLVKAGYVERRPCPGDGRGHLLAITAPGRSLQERMWPVYRAAISRHVGAKLGDDGRASVLAELLGALLKEGKKGADDGSIPIDDAIA